ncbi:MAG: glycerol-3-phosphate dehydrogenase [NAD(P)+] [Candidatus Tyloplasma litorale]|nr:MAG: glycerol-3-phosphate dehydrogenase [NAD(P)+] [Mycoplasmatales bacterium]
MENIIDTDSKKIVVVGSGAFGTAIAESLVRNEDSNNEIILFGINQKEINDINKNRKNSKYYSLKLSPKLKGTYKPEEAFIDADIILLVVPSAALSVCINESIIPYLTKPAHFVNLSKGFDYLNQNTLSKAIKSIIPPQMCEGVYKLAGASFASEVIEKQPTYFVLASDDIEKSKLIAKELSNKTMKITPYNSIEAIEWLSIIKNPLALLQGVIAGLGYKVNTRALFFTKALNEMKIIFEFLGYDDNIIFSPAGIGDLYLTGTSRKSRNYKTGYTIGKNNKVTKKILERFSTVEGIRSIEVLLRIAAKNDLKLNLIELLYNITYKKEKPSKIISEFLDGL